ncbi:MAG: hypothetical protein ACREHD_14830, partial [Pirellulales bacterium]
LYYTARKIQEQNLDRALQAAELSVRRGLTDDAREQERLAGKGIGELRQGIERAAESVLGDDTEALRRAREELERLTEELGDEVARNTGEEVRVQGSDRGFRVQGSGFREEKGGEQAREAGQDSHRSPHRVPSGWREGNPSPSGDGEPMPESNAPDSTRDNSPGEQREQSQRGQSNQGRSNQSQSNEGQPNQEGQANQTGQPNGGDSRQAGEQRGTGGARNRGGPQRLAGGSNTSSGTGGFNDLFDAGTRARAPIAGEDFRDWSDRLRDVEEMIDDPALRAEAARIRERARGIRAELKRHSKEPNWELVKIDVSRPLEELRDRVSQELLRRTSKDALLPLDRDPVPPKYSEKTRRYYERLGSGR